MHFLGWNKSDTACHHAGWLVLGLETSLRDELPEAANPFYPWGFLWLSGLFGVRRNSLVF